MNWVPLALTMLTLVTWPTVGFSAAAQQQLHAGEYSQPDIERGSQLFSSQCSVCHGDSGSQVPGVSLLSGSFRRASSDEELAGIIKNGIQGTAMVQGNYTQQELAALVAYLRSATANRADADAAVRAGNAMRGEALFHGKGKCDTCHRVRGTGGFRGPNLSDIGRFRSDDSLLQSLIDPSAEITPLNQEIKVITRRGQTIVGRRMNEDTHSLQLIQEEQGRLIALMKSDIREMSVEKTSPMPSYRGRLTESEIADLVAFLRSLTPVEPGK